MAASTTTATHAAMAAARTRQPVGGEPPGTTARPTGPGRHAPLGIAAPGDGSPAGTSAERRAPLAGRAEHPRGLCVRAAGHTAVIAVPGALEWSSRLFSRRAPVGIPSNSIELTIRGPLAEAHGRPSRLIPGTR